MKFAVIGAGAAGLGAAWKLLAAGHSVTVYEKDSEVGGRCRTHCWNGEWIIRGAAAFIQAEENLVQQAKELGIYNEADLANLNHNHVWNVFRRNASLIHLKELSPGHILTCAEMPLMEKLALATAFPVLIRSLANKDRDDSTTAVELDNVTACEYFRGKSPFLVDYLLEPVMQTFCGYGEEDFSLAWFAWWLSGHTSTSVDWWTFKEGGVGTLTRVLGERISAREQGVVRTGAAVQRVSMDESGVTIAVLAGGVQAVERYDGVVVAVPGSRVSSIVDTLSDAERRFFSAVQYVSHHVCHVVLDLSPEQQYCTRRVLPTVEGFSTVSNFSIWPMQSEGRHMLYFEIKGAASAKLSSSPDAALLEEALAEIREVEPKVATARIFDSHVQRNDIALCRRYVGYTEALRAFHSLKPKARIAFAGDYLINSTVGQAHRSGQLAADQLLRSAA